MCGRDASARAIATRCRSPAPIGTVLETLGEPDLDECVRGRLARRPTGASHLQAQLDVLARGQVGHETGFLGDERDLPAPQSLWGAKIRCPLREITDLQAGR